MNGLRLTNYIKLAIQQTNERIKGLDTKYRIKYNEQEIMNEALKEMSTRNFQRTQDITEFIWQTMQRVAQRSSRTKEKEDLKRVEGEIRQMIEDQINSDFQIRMIEHLPAKPQEL